MKIQQILIIFLLLLFCEKDLYSQTFSRDRDMVGHNVYFYNLEDVWVNNSKNKLVQVIDYSNYPELNKMTLFYVNRIFMVKSTTMIEILSKETSAKYYLSADGRYVYKKARDYDYWKKQIEVLNSKNPHWPSYDTLKIQLDDVDWEKLFYSAKYEDVEFKEDGTILYIVKINSPDSIFQRKYNKDKCPIIFEDEMNQIKQKYLEKQKKLREIEIKRIKDSIIISRIDADLMTRAPKATVRLESNYTDHVVAYYTEDENKKINIDKLQYVFVYDAVFKYDNATRTEYIYLKGFNYKNDIIVCYNDGLDFNSFYRDDYTVDNHPNVLSFLKRNQGINIENRKELCRKAALEDWKIDSTRMENEKRFFKNLQTKKICIVGQARMFNMMLFDIYNCFNKRIVKIKYSVTDGRHNESGEYPMNLGPGNLKEALPIGNSKIQNLQDANNTKLSSITFVFADGTSISYSGTNIKLHTKLCYYDKKGWIFD